RRQGAREVSADRRSGVAVRRRRGGAGGAGETALAIEFLVGGPIALAAGTIAAAMNGRLVTGDDDRYVTGFSIDSRTLASGDLFFAILAARAGHALAQGTARREAAR